MLADVGDDVAQLKGTVNTLGAQMTELKIDNENLNKKVDELLSENAVLRTQLKQSTSNKISPKPKPWSTLNDIKKNISEMVKTEPDKYNTTYIVAGSIDHNH